MKILFFGLMMSVSLSLIAQEIPSPDSIQEKLFKGNDRYVKGELEHPNLSDSRRQETQGGQSPVAIILGCSDSRVPPEIIFDQGVGDLFIVRVAGNVAGPIEVDSIEFAVTQFHCPLIIVLGHKNCGAVKAVLAGQVPEADPIAQLISPAIKCAKKLSGDLLENSVKMNVEIIVKQLENNPVIAERISKQTLKIIGGYYDLESGKVGILPRSSS